MFTRTRVALAGAATLALFMTGTAVVASAQPVPARGIPVQVLSGACAEASVRVETAARLAVDAADALADVQDVISEALRTRVTTAQNVLTALFDENPLNLTAIARAQVELQDALRALAGASVETGPEYEALITARANLRAAIDVAEEACEVTPPTEPTTTSPPTTLPTTEPSPTTSTSPTTTRRPSTDDGVDDFPVGGVDTGVGPE